MSSAQSEAMPLPAAGVPGRREELLAGIRSELPLLLGVVPFGLIYGALALAAGLPAEIAQAMSSVVFAGSSQFVIVQMVAAASPLLMLLPAVLVVNLRHALYSASMAPYLAGLSRSWRMLLAYLLTDEAYAVAIVRFQADTAPFRHWFLLGAGFALWAGWQASTAAGVILGASVPSAWSLDFALPLTFVAMLVPLLRGRASLVACGVAALVAVVAYDLPLKLALIVAALSGVAAGLVVNWTSTRR